MVICRGGRGPPVPLAASVEAGAAAVVAGGCSRSWGWLAALALPYWALSGWYNHTSGLRPCRSTATSEGSTMPGSEARGLSQSSIPSQRPLWTKMPDVWDAVRIDT